MCYFQSLRPEGFQSLEGIREKSARFLDILNGTDELDAELARISCEHLGHRVDDVIRPGASTCSGKL